MIVSEKEVLGDTHAVLSSEVRSLCNPSRRFWVVYFRTLPTGGTHLCLFHRFFLYHYTLQDYELRPFRAVSPVHSSPASFLTAAPMDRTYSSRWDHGSDGDGGGGGFVSGQDKVLGIAISAGTIAKAHLLVSRRCA